MAWVYPQLRVLTGVIVRVSLFFCCWFYVYSLLVCFLILFADTSMRLIITLLIAYYYDKTMYVLA